MISEDEILEELDVDMLDAAVPATTEWLTALLAVFIEQEGGRSLESATIQQLQQGYIKDAASIRELEAHIHQRLE
jgi:hypothetical protein